MNDKTCPVCGANALILRTESQVLKESFGGQKEIKIKNYYCSTCESTGDFFNENEAILNNNINLLKTQSIKNILNDFSENKISMSAIERALSLPQRTLTKWKNGVSTPSSTGLALMKFLRTFPWLLEVAENNFDYNIAQKIHINSAIQKFLNLINFNTHDFSEARIIATSQSAFLYMEFDKSPNFVNYPDNILVNVLGTNEQVQTTTQ